MSECEDCARLQRMSDNAWAMLEIANATNASLSVENKELRARRRLVAHRDHLISERDEALGLLKALRSQVGEWAERINRHDVPDEFVTYVDANQRLLDIIWEMRDAASGKQGEMS